MVSILMGEGKLKSNKCHEKITATDAGKRAREGGGMDKERAHGTNI